MPVVDTNSTIWNPFSGYISGSPMVYEELHLSIMDADEQVPIPVGGVSAWDGDYLQTISVCNAPLKFAYVSSFNSAVFTTDELFTRRLSKVLAGACFTNASATVVVSMLAKDVSGVFTLIASATLTASTIQDENDYYLAPIQEFTTYGADLVKFVVAAPSAGEVSFRMAAV